LEDNGDARPLERPRYAAQQEMDMMKHGKLCSSALIMVALLFALPGCQKKEGPLEKAGREIDQTVENFGQPKAGPAEKAGQAIDNAMGKTGQQVEKAGDHIQDAAKGDKP
jgi:hypothetical protein